jgi:hypothetical protein
LAIMVRPLVLIVVFILGWVLLVQAIEATRPAGESAAAASEEGAAGGEDPAVAPPAGGGDAGGGADGDEPRWAETPADDGGITLERTVDDAIARASDLVEQVGTQVLSGTASLIATTLVASVFSSRRDQRDRKSRADERSEALDRASGPGAGAGDVDMDVIDGYRSIAAMASRESTELHEEVKRRLAETLEERERYRRSEVFRFVLFTAILFSMWAPVTSLLEGWVSGQGEGAWSIIGEAGALWFIGDYAQSIFLALGAAAIAGLLYAVYFLRCRRRSVATAALIGGMGVGLAGFVSLIYLTPAIFTAVREAGYGAPLVRDAAGEAVVTVPLMYFLGFARLMAFPIVAFLGAIAAHALIGLFTRPPGGEGRGEQRLPEIRARPASPASAGAPARA